EEHDGGHVASVPRSTTPPPGPPRAPAVGPTPHPRSRTHPAPLQPGRLCGKSGGCGGCALSWSTVRTLSGLVSTARVHNLSGAGGAGGAGRVSRGRARAPSRRDRKSTRLNSSHVSISYAVFCL